MIPGCRPIPLHFEVNVRYVDGYVGGDTRPSLPGKVVRRPTLREIVIPSLLHLGAWMDDQPYPSARQRRENVVLMTQVPSQLARIRRNEKLSGSYSPIVSILLVHMGCYIIQDT